MKLIKNLRLSAQLYLLVGVSMLVAASLVAYSVSRLNGAQAAVAAVADSRAADLEKVRAARESLQAAADAPRDAAAEAQVAAAAAELDTVLGEQEAAAAARAAAEADHAAAVRNSLVLLLLGALAAVALAAYVIRHVTRTLGADPEAVAAIARRMAHGDLNFRVDDAPAGDESLMGQLAQMKSSLLASRLNYEGQLSGIHRTQAVIEFTPDGTVLDANENFLKTMGYTLDEIKGKHHSLFIDAQERQGAEYAGFWPRLARGEAFIGRVRRVARDGRDVMLQCIYNPLPDENGKTFKVVKYATDITADHKEAALNEAFKGALNKLSANVMVADSDSNIIYMNEGADRLMHEAESDFRAQLPNFSPNRILGQSFDIFHKNPAHQRGLLSNLKGRHETQVKIAGRTMKLVANPMYDAAGRRLGTVVEWFDRSQEVGTEAELQQMITAVTAGDLSGRIALAGKTGFFESLSRGINDLVDSVATVVDEVQGLVKAANDGDLTFRVRLEGRAGLLVKIGSGINQLTDNMASLVARVKSAAGEVSRGADEISQGNTNLSQRTEEQASSLEETASSMEEMTSTVKQNADNAGQANQLAVAARDQAEKGGAVVARAVKAMSEINDASKRIADIIGVIDEIAFQTNLLALNAAVEAARAGEQGRGFAVVASEVRNLAGRSATAAKEIKALIQDSVRKVDEGSSLVTQSGSTLEQIVSAVKKVTDIVAEIAAASHEQSSGIEQVNKAVMQLDELTQQNAALVEEASAASQAMAEQARGLNDALSIYTVDDKALVQAGAFGNVGHAAAPAGAAPDRRATVKRPWTKKPAPAAAPALKATGTGDDVWKEF